MILSFAEKKKYKIGRSKDADICDKADPLISRINSLISEVDGKYFMIKGVYLFVITNQNMGRVYYWPIQ
jgi:hypothetical protein